MGAGAGLGAASGFDRLAAFGVGAASWMAVMGWPSGPRRSKRGGVFIVMLSTSDAPPHSPPQTAISSSRMKRMMWYSRSVYVSGGEVSSAVRLRGGWGAGLR